MFMLKTFVFPSVCRPFDGMLDTSPEDGIFAPLALKFRGKEYLVGKIPDILDEINPVSPFGAKFQLLARMALLLADTEDGGRVSLTVSLPSFLYAYRDMVEKSLQGKITVDFGASQVCKEYISRVIDISHLQVISRLDSCVAAIRRGNIREEGDFLVVNLGQGACEATVSIAGTPAGRQFCVRGIRAGIDLGIGSESLQQALFGRQTAKASVPRLRKEVLRRYYQDIISSNIRDVLSGQKDNCSKIYLCGDGAAYPELVQCFRDEFGERFSISVYPSPERCASQGCSIQSLSARHRLSETPGSALAVGLDVDDRYTCVSVSMGKL